MSMKIQMKRQAYDLLEQWKSSPNRKPLILKGARQVGKTFLLKTFGTKSYKDVAYFNFEEMSQIKEFFAGNIKPEKILERLSIYREKKIEAGSTLIILDEIQECAQALTSLKYFLEHAPEYHVTAAGSLLGVKLASTSPFPVGKVEIVDLYPFNFFEFLDAIGKSSIKEYLRKVKNWKPLETAFHEDLIYHLKLYTFIGGMPEMISEYVRTNDLNIIRSAQLQILKSYAADFSKYSTPTDSIRITQVWDSLAASLARENKKFKYAEIKKGARAALYETAIQWLKDAGLINLCYGLNNVKLPLSAYKDTSKFKVYLFDTGLLGAKLDISMKSIVEKDDLFSQFSGVLAENYVAQQLRSRDQGDLFYWEIPQKAEIDFIYEQDGRIFPLEVKSGPLSGNASARRYQEKFHAEFVCTTSAQNFSEGGGFCNFPLYSVLLFPELCTRCAPEG